MRNLNELNRYRRTDRAVMELWGWIGDEGNGAFRVPSPIDKRFMTVIASNGQGWDHVSVSRETRCPNWIEMDHVKRLFFNEDETAVQFHVPSTDHVNLHRFCLHLWRCQDTEFPRPPGILVGVGDRPTRDLEDALQMMRSAGFDNHL